jgi:phosphocarrier protein HPr
MQNKTVKIANPQGLHARPATAFVTKASSFASTINIMKDHKKVNGKSIMGVMTLAAKKGDEIILEANGLDEMEAIHALSKILETVYG